MEPHIVLGVSASASEKDINDAFRTLAKRWHPDRNPGNLEEATEKMKEINGAHKTMLRRAARAKAKATARAGESSSSPADHNPSSSSEGSTSASSQASSSYTPSEKTSSSDGSDWIPPKPPCPNRKQSKDSDHRPQRTFSSFLPQPFRRSTSPTHTSPPSSDINLTNEYSESFLIGRISKEWVHPIKLSLEDLFHGKRFNVRLERYQLGGKRRPVVLAINVPVGCAAGTKIIFENAGHEDRDGRKQDIVFVIEEAKHRDFTRTRDDLSINVEIPWDDRLTEGKQRMRLEGLGGEDVWFTIDHRRDHAMEGSVQVPEAGMPMCDGPLRRGNLTIHWKIDKTGSGWLRNVFRMKG